MRLNAWLARAGVASRRKSDELIKAGRVTVNGEPGQLNTFVAAHRRRAPRRRAAAEAAARLRAPAQARRRRHDGERPGGSPDRRRPRRPPARVVPVGRLDADTTGAILLTNDGDLAHRLAHPKYEVDKVYVAELWQQPTDGILRKLADGVKLDEDGAKTAPAQVRRISRRRRRADDPRGTQPAGEAHVRGRRAPREAVAPQPLRLASTSKGSSPARWRELEPSEVEELRPATKHAASACA